mmetsp:Transcript_45246/g.84731  ORF Transcript_45246/g.84731 Transcript_45246/m.84731 type:complete len:80 (-) Transcript_45246:1972-2211(-)
MIRLRAIYIVGTLLQDSQYPSVGLVFVSTAQWRAGEVAQPTLDQEAFVTCCCQRTQQQSQGCLRKKRPRKQTLIRKKTL